MPKPASTAGGLDPSQPLPRCVQHQCFFEGDHASVGTDFGVACLNCCQLQMPRTSQNHTMDVTDDVDDMDSMDSMDAMDSMDTKHKFLIRCTEEVAQGSFAVKWVFAGSMNFTASFLHEVGHRRDTLGHSPVQKNQDLSDSKCIGCIGCIGAWMSPGWSRLGKCHTRPALCCRPTRSHLPGF